MYKEESQKKKQEIRWIDDSDDENYDSMMKLKGKL
jgi:hypothetical protein